MRRSALSATLAIAALGLSGLVASAHAAPAPAAAVVVAQDPVTEAELEAAAEVFEATLTALVAEVEAIRADTSLSDADKDSRMRAAIDARQPEIDAFIALLGSYVRQQTLADGGTEEDAEMAVAMIEGMFAGMLVQGILSGELAAEMAADGE